MNLGRITHRTAPLLRFVVFVGIEKNQSETNELVMNCQVGGNDRGVRWCSCLFTEMLTTAAKWAHLYSLSMAHRLDAHRMAAVARLETTTSFLTTLTMTSKQGNDECIMDDNQSVLSTLFVMITVTRIFPLSLDQNNFFYCFLSAGCSKFLLLICMFNFKYHL